MLQLDESNCLWFVEQVLRTLARESETPEVVGDLLQAFTSHPRTVLATELKPVIGIWEKTYCLVVGQTTAASVVWCS